MPWWRRARPRQRAWIAASHALGAYRRPCWLIGDGRSGTTWAGDLLTAGRDVRIAFEPFHPTRNPALAGLTMHEYRRPADDDPRLTELFGRIFAGWTTSPWIDREWRPAAHTGYLVKDVFACLVAKWALGRHPHVAPLLIVRHPFAVAKSKRAQFPEWEWLTDVGSVLTDERLVADHLADQVGMIEEVSQGRNLLLNHIANWAMIHRVLFRQFGRAELPVLSYEELVADPSAALAPVREAYPDMVRGIAAADLEATAGKISPVADAASVSRQRLSLRTAWREGLEPSEIAAGRRVLDAFGLDGLFGEDWFLRREAMRSFPIGS